MDKKPLQDNNFQFGDAYDPFDEALQNRDKEILLEGIKRTNAIGDKARQCLATACFESYRQEFASAKEKILGAMMSETNRYLAVSSNVDVAQYAARMVAFLTRVQALTSMLQVIEADSKKGALSGEDATNIS